MQLTFLPQADIVAGEVAAAQAVAPQLSQVSSGSVAFAIFQAFASVGLWLQWLIAQVLSMTRLATSQGPDVDSFVGDFGLSRLAAIPATGFVTFSRGIASGAALIPVGAQVKTADGSQAFTVYADPTSVAWNATLNGYVMANSVSALDVGVQAVNPGAQGNVQANTVTLIATALPGVDAVNNSAAFPNGADAETDAALRSRFAAYIQGLSRSTGAAISAAIDGVQQGLAFTIEDGTPEAAQVTITVDDGSGAPSAPLLANVAQAVNAVRAAGVQAIVQGPSVVGATISCTLNPAPSVVSSAARNALVATITSAWLAYVDALPVGAPLAASNLVVAAYVAAPGQIASIDGILLNGGTSDIAPPKTGVVKVAGGAAGITI